MSLTTDVHCQILQTNYNITSKQTLITAKFNHTPFCYIASGLEEAGMVVFLQALFGLCDEGAGALQTLATVCNLLGQFTQFHHLEQTQIQTCGYAVKH